MASPSIPRPARPNEPPSRHSISGTSGSRLKDAHTPLRSDHLTPTRAKLKHAATTPSTSAAGAAALTLNDNSPHVCHNCHQMETRFYCDPCITSRLETHHNEMRRLSLARDKAKASVNNLLFDKASSSDSPIPSLTSIQVTPPPVLNDNTLPDPFDTNAAEPSFISPASSDASDRHLLLHTLIQLRAQRAAVISRVQTIHQCISESQHSHLQGKEALKEKLAHIALRKQNLAKAWSGLEGSSAPPNASAAQRSRLAAKSRWLAHPAADHIDVPLVYTDVYTHYERQPDDSPTTTPTSAQESTDYQLGATLTRARLHLASLQAEANTVSAELSATRAALARQAFALYCVSPPDTLSSKSSTFPKTRQVDLSASSSVAQRISRLSERYIPGAFGLGHAQSTSSTASTRNSNCDATSTSRSATAKDPGASPSSASSSSNWSIAFLPLPLPSEARRYPRDTVNGAVTYAANLLQLLAGYLGSLSVPTHSGMAVEDRVPRRSICPRVPTPTSLQLIQRRLDRPSSTISQSPP